MLTSVIALTVVLSMVCAPGLISESRAAAEARRAEGDA